ncbi:hypothetical protein Hjap01_03827 [Haloarcula japonica]
MAVTRSQPSADDQPARVSAGAIVQSVRGPEPVAVIAINTSVILFIHQLIRNPKLRVYLLLVAVVFAGCTGVCKRMQQSQQTMKNRVHTRRNHHKRNGQQCRQRQQQTLLMLITTMTDFLMHTNRNCLQIRMIQIPMAMSYIQIVSTVENLDNAMSKGGLAVDSVAYVELSSNEITGYILCTNSDTC